MKTLFILGSLILSSSSFSQGLFSGCGEYRVMPSCGQFPVLTPVLITPQLSVRLEASCPEESLELCSLRDSILSLMKEGEKYCMAGIKSDWYEPGCTDISVGINWVRPAQN